MESSSSSSAAVPTLRVMRLQSPELHVSQHQHQQNYNGNSCAFALQTALCLPDSLTVFVGESFTAYLGVLNSSPYLPIRRLSVSAQLQTPSQRHQLPAPSLCSSSSCSTTSDDGNSNGVHVAPESSVDAIVSRTIDEPGPHILRVEVGYATAEGGRQTFRKFYRFAVLEPASVSIDKVMRMGDTTCLVEVTVEYPPKDGSNSVDDTPNSKHNNDTLVIASCVWEPTPGFTATQIDCQAATTATPDDTTKRPPPTAVELWDSVGTLMRRTTLPIATDTNTETSKITTTTASNNNALFMPSFSSKLSYIFAVQASSKEAQLRGIAAGDPLGRAAVTWRKAMGETGTIYSHNNNSNSTSVLCPPADPSARTMPNGVKTNHTNNHFMVHRSGWTVDMAAAAASIATSPHNPQGGGSTLKNQQQQQSMIVVTVEPIDPPSRVILQEPVTVQFLIVNHSVQTMPLQLQFHNNTSGTTTAAAPKAPSCTSLAPAPLEIHPQHGCLAVSGPSFQNVGDIPGQGGSTVVPVTFLPLYTGLCRVQSCSVLDLASGREILQPPLFTTFVVEKE